MDGDVSVAYGAMNGFGDLYKHVIFESTSCRVRLCTRHVSEVCVVLCLSVHKIDATVVLRREA